MAEANDKPADQDAASSLADSATPPAPKRRRRRWLRLALLTTGPVLVLLVGAYVYMNSGRYVETENAYLKADTVVLSAEVPGKIVRVAVRENEPVQAGDVLFEIDDSSYRVARDRAKSQLEAVQSFIRGLQFSYQQALEELKLARTNVAYQEREVAREQSLAERQLGSESDLDEARHELEIAQQQIPIIEQRLAQLRAQLGGAIHPGLQDHPAYRTVKSMLENAELELAHTVVRAPINGVASRVPLSGGYLARGSPAMSVISTEHVWIEANFKETQLEHVRVGQPVAIRIDTYPGQQWQGTVESISQATGAEFSVIPAQNASGNWVKVAQRIPVRIVVERQSRDFPLRAGMSAVVEIDTGYERPAPRFFGFLTALRTDRTEHR
jgi:membrane fusion protein (multidrug efflux system)